MNNIYTFKPSGNVFRCNEVLGIARNELRQIINEMNSRGLDSNMRHKVIDNGATHIVVMCLSSGNNRIAIDSSYSKEPTKRFSHRSKLLHCRIELTLMNEIPLYTKDPAFFVVEPLPVGERKVFLHTLFYIEKKQGLELDADTLDPKLTLKEAKPIIEKKTGYSLVPKLKKQYFEEVERIIPAKPTEECDFSELNNSSFWDKLTHPRKFEAIQYSGQLYFHPGPLMSETCVERKTIEKGTVNEENICVKWEAKDDVGEFAGLQDSHTVQTQYRKFDGYTYRKSTSYGYKQDEREIAYVERRIKEPYNIFKVPMTLYPDYAKKMDLIKAETDPKKAKMLLAILMESGEDGFAKFHQYHDFESFQFCANSNCSKIKAVGNINNEPIHHSYGITNHIFTPLVYVYADFTARKLDKVYIGDISTLVTQRPALRINFKSDGDDYNSWGKYYQCIDYAPVLSIDAKLTNNIIPYYVEAKDKRKILEKYYNFTTDKGIYCSDVDPVDKPFSELPLRSEYPARRILPGLLFQFAFSAIDYACYMSHSSSYMKHPFVYETYSKGLVDLVDMDYMSSPTESISNDYCYWGMFRASADIPNRHIFCIRSFFANTKNATSLASTRKSYTVTYPKKGEYNSLNSCIFNKDSPEEIPTETSQPLSSFNCPNFTTIKGDLVIVNLMSSIYAVSDYGAIGENNLCLSTNHPDYSELEKFIPRHLNADSNQVSEITAHRPWPKFLDSDWKYTNIYGAGVRVDIVASIGQQYNYNKTTGKTDDQFKLEAMNGEIVQNFYDRAYRGESIYSDSDEDISTRYIPERKDEDGEALPLPDVTWKEEDTPESHMIHCIYRALEKEGYDIHYPICDIKLEANLYDREVYDDTGEVVQ